MNELRFFYLLEWSANVSDIREQFPLWPLEETERIARELGLKHPAPPGGGLLVMTSDFRVTLKGGKDVVRTIKAAADLNDERVLQKLDIEREYWQRHYMDWGIVVAEDIPLPMVKNIQWLHPHLTLDGLELDPDDVQPAIRHLTAEVCSDRGVALADIARCCDDDFGFPRGTSLALARHLLATRMWQTNMNEPISASRPLLLHESRVA